MIVDGVEDAVEGRRVEEIEDILWSFEDGREDGRVEDRAVPVPVIVTTEGKEVDMRKKGTDYIAGMKNR